MGNMGGGAPRGMGGVQLGGSQGQPGRSMPFQGPAGRQPTGPAYVPTAQTTPGVSSTGAGGATGSVFGNFADAYDVDPSFFEGSYAPSGPNPSPGMGGQTIHGLSDPWSPTPAAGQTIHGMSDPYAGSYDVDPSGFYGSDEGYAADDAYQIGRQALAALKRSM